MHTAIFDVDIVKNVIDTHKSMPGAMLPILHGVQDALGYIPSDAVPLIAQGLNVSRAEVHGVVTFYHHFRQAPAGKHVMQVCRAEACQSVGAERLAAHISKTLGCNFHQTTADGSVTLEPVYCLGQCAVGPAMMIDGEVYARVTPARFDVLLAAQRDST
jgi:formate dehydrogenase subunit gamma